jgi:hypothetical protein
VAVARIAEQFEVLDNLSETTPFVLPDAPDESETIAGLRATIAALTARLREFL